VQRPNITCGACSTRGPRTSNSLRFRDQVLASSGWTTLSSAPRSSSSVTTGPRPRVAPEVRDAKLTIPAPAWVPNRGGPSRSTRRVSPTSPCFLETSAPPRGRGSGGWPCLLCNLPQLDQHHPCLPHDPLSVPRSPSAARKRRSPARDLHPVPSPGAAGQARRDDGATHMCRCNFRSSCVGPGGLDFFVADPCSTS